MFEVTWASSMTKKFNKTKVISADLLDFSFNSDLDFYDIFIFCDIPVLVAFQFFVTF